MDFLLDPNIWIAFAMLTALEIVLGVDNIIFISILVGRLPPEQRDKARRLGLGFAMFSRLALLFSLSWVMGLTAEVFNVAGNSISGRDIVLLLGGLFLALGLPCVGSWAAFGSGMRRYLQDPVKLRLFNRSMALALVASLVPMLMN